jgi:hypothetical protein
MKELLCVAKRV